MKSSQVLLAAAALGAAFVTTVSAASSVPNLRSAVARNRHVVVVYSLGELLPGHILVATRAQTAPNGKLLKANVRLNEQLTGTKVANAGIILDNFQQGRRKAIWVSEKRTLMEDAKRDWSGLGQDPNLIINTSKVANGYRMRTRHTLGTGRYYVQVSGVVVGLDCTPKKPCQTDWSNVRRVVIK